MEAVLANDRQRVLRHGVSCGRLQIKGRRTGRKGELEGAENPLGLARRERRARAQRHSPHQADGLAELYRPAHVQTGAGWMEPSPLPSP